MPASPLAAMRRSSARCAGCATRRRRLAILGASGLSGSGRSSFLRAGLLPRLACDDRNFALLPVIRLERAALTGDEGLVPALENGARRARIAAHVLISV
jgi:hypothetical protein